MPASVTVNGMTVVHKSSDGISTAFPDVCKTPAAPSPLPIPYPNVAKSSDAADTASSVTADGNPLMVKDSKYAMSTGDEAGSLQGVMSNKIKGSANPQAWSFDVKAEGKNVFRQLDLMLQNGGSKPINTPPTPNVQAPKPAFGSGKDPKKRKIKEVKWDTAKCKCGDKVKLSCKTENFENGDSLPVKITRDPSQKKKKKSSKKPEAIDEVIGKIKGDAAEIPWISRNGTWRKSPPVKLVAKANGMEPKSASPLEIEPVPEKIDPVSDPGNSAKAITGIKIPFTRFAITWKTGNKWDNPYGYEASIKDGRFTIHCKIQLDIQPGVNMAKLPGWKHRWKQEIEGIWNKKWKFHRKACKRGKDCDCPGGCCLWPIHVRCTFVAGGGDVVVKLHPGAPAGGLWWNAGEWFEQLNGLEGNGAVVHAHEFGHNIGMWDEYGFNFWQKDWTGNPMSTGAVTGLRYDVKGSIMQSGTKVMKQHWTKHPSAGKDINTWFDKATGEAYEPLEL